MEPMQMVRKRARCRGRLSRLHCQKSLVLLMLVLLQYVLGVGPSRQRPRLPLHSKTNQIHNLVGVLP
jgi:hypothetical protein